MKEGKCPKCGSTEIFSGAEVVLKKGPFGSNAIPISLTSVVALDNYVCGDCGMLESYVSDPVKLAEIARRWKRVNSEEPEKTAAS